MPIVRPRLIHDRLTFFAPLSYMDHMRHSLMWYIATQKEHIVKNDSIMPTDKPSVGIYLQCNLKSLSAYRPYPFFHLGQTTAKHSSQMHEPITLPSLPLLLLCFYVLVLVVMFGACLPVFEHCLQTVCVFFRNGSVLLAVRLEKGYGPVVFCSTTL